MANVLIGNIRGPQGEPGPENNIIAQVYQFCESESGDKIPDGPWLSQLPEIHKGMYIWCRNISTWQHGDDSYLYSVGYIGQDGTFNGLEIVDSMGKRIDALETRITPIDKGGTGASTLDGAQAKLGITALKESLENVKADLEAEIDGINDYTTGNNLIRGSREWNKGTHAVVASTYTDDGFYFYGESYMSTWVDDYGYTVLNIKRSGASSDVTYSANAIIPKLSLKKGDYFTASFEFMVDDVNAMDAWNGIYYAFLKSPDNTGSYYSAKSTSLKTFEPDIKSGIWYKAVLPIAVDFDGEDVYFRINVLLQRNGSVNYRKFMLQPGKIDNPIYAPNPNDVDYINDKTTEKNLLRGTRDLTIGTEHNSLNGSYLVDGITSITNGTISKSDDGFAIVHFEETGGITTDKADKRMIAATSNVIKPGQTYTVAMLVYSENLNAIDNKNVLQCIVESGPSKTVVSKLFTLNDLGVTESGKWQVAKAYIDIPSTLDSKAYMLCVPRLYRNGSIYFTQPMVYFDRINNPVWSASPFDVVQQKAFDSLLNSSPVVLGEQDWNTKAIVDESDLNNYTKAGVYFRAYTANASTIKNAPAGLNTAYKLYVDYSNGLPSYIVQRLVTYNALTEYVRTKLNTSSWSEWRQTVNNKSIIGYEQGGTNSDSLAGAKSNLGITALETRVKALEDQIAALIS